jgi:hypothetical protein
MITSKHTAVNKYKVPRLFKIIDKHYGWKKNTTNLDLGGGPWNIATRYLKRKGVINLVDDVFNRPLKYSFAVLSYLTAHKVDTVTLSNVLNVIKERGDRKTILYNSLGHLKKGGVIYISVYEGNKSGKGKVTKPDCWQENKTLKAYLSMVKKVFSNARIEHGIIIGEK